MWADAAARSLVSYSHRLEGKARSASFPAGLTAGMAKPLGVMTHVPLIVVGKAADASCHVTALAQLGKAAPVRIPSTTHLLKGKERRR